MFVHEQQSQQENETIKIYADQLYYGMKIYIHFLWKQTMFKPKFIFVLLKSTKSKYFDLTINLTTCLQL